MTITQEALKQEGLNILKQFCELNNMPMPKIHFVNKSKYGGCGWYENKVCYIVPSACATPAVNPGFKWSYPHYLVDRTLLGVICHEFGHYVHECLKYPKIGRLGLKITGYEPNMDERFAETMKVFLTNPDLLKHYNPKRYDYLTKRLKLKPVYTADWKTQLNIYGPVNQKYITACENKIKYANSQN